MVSKVSWKSTFSFGLISLTLGLLSSPMSAQVYIPVPVVRKYFATFAYSSSAKYLAYSVNASSRREAEEIALEVCKQRNIEDCVPITTFSNTCGGVAVHPNGGYGWGYSDRERLAGEQALEECIKINGIECEIKHTLCTINS